MPTEDTATKTGLVWHERYMWHDTSTHAAFMPAGGFVEPDRHAESPASKRRLRNLIEVSGLIDHLVAIPPRTATREELLAIHDEGYLERLERLSEGSGGDAGPETVDDDGTVREASPSPFGAGGYEIARLAAGGCLSAVEAVLDGSVANAYALVRPPGHHAEADRGMGTCLLSNVAIAARRAQALGAKRVAVIDWDVHHGNGTQEAFWRDPDVLVISLHQAGCYPPDSGTLDERGEGPGERTTLNVPLPPGSGEGAYVAAMERAVLPALRRFAPDLILVSCGLDANVMDPLGRQALHSDAFRRLARFTVEAAAETCEGRLVLCHEGGYSPAYVPFCGLAVVEELSGIETGVEDPFLAGWRRLPYQELLPHQEAVVASAAAQAEELSG